MEFQFAFKLLPTPEGWRELGRFRANSGGRAVAGESREWELLHRHEPTPSTSSPLCFISTTYCNPGSPKSERSGPVFPFYHVPTP